MPVLSLVDFETTVPVAHSDWRPGVPMIVLYVVTGTMSFILGAVIVSGAIRAARDPERYGPRRGGVDGNGQSRAKGLTRAMLETFPIVKFRTAWSEAAGLQRAEMEETRSPTSALETSQVGSPTIEELDEVVIPPEIGHNICPICIVDFEEGDELRVLPCDGSHRFHTTCVDPWLLEISTACPICRHDFRTLESMISGVSEELESGEHARGAGRRSSRIRRFSRYLRAIPVGNRVPNVLSQ